MNEVVLDGKNGCVLSLRRVVFPGPEAHLVYQATLTLPSATGTTEVWDDPDLLAPFFRRLADAWSGFDGVVEYRSLERQMHLACTHDGVGTVACVVTLGEPWRSTLPSCRA